MRLLVTRPEPDAQALAERLATLGHETVVEPLMHIEFPIEGALPSQAIQAVIATSRNGVRALMRNPACDALATKPVFAVGPATAECCKQAGFQTIHVGSGSAMSLIPLIRDLGRAGAGRLLHLAGEVLAIDIKTPLEKQGFEVVAPVTYRSIPATRLSESVRLQIAGGRIDGVILMSPRSAQIFQGLILADKLAGPVRQLLIYCLSDAVADALSELGPVQTRVAAEARLEVLLALIQNEAAL